MKQDNTPPRSVRKEILEISIEERSEDFISFVDAVSRASSKTTETLLIKQELHDMERKLAEPSLPNAIVAECLVRVLFCQMLGTDRTEFANIRAVNLCSSTNLLEKRLGYMTVRMLLGHENGMSLLVVNTLQKDLMSVDSRVVAVALTAAATIVHEQAVLAVLPLILKLISHKHPAIRKMAILALQSLHGKRPQLVPDLDRCIQKSLSDADLGVVSAALAVLESRLVSTRSESVAFYKDSIQTLASILKQIIESRTRKSNLFFGVPLPWLRIRLLRIIALLGRDDSRISLDMEILLKQVLKRAESKFDKQIGRAVVYECVKTIASIRPTETLFGMACAATSRFIAPGASPTDVTIGLSCLSELVLLDPSTVRRYQVSVLACLRQKTDDVVQRKALDLLFRIANPSNLEVICDRFLSALKSNITDEHVARDFTRKVSVLAERYAPSGSWYVSVLNKLLFLAPRHVSRDSVQKLLRVISEGLSDEDEENSALRASCVEEYLVLLETGAYMLPDVFVEVATWVCGEYGYLTTKYSVPQILDILCHLMERMYELPRTKCWIITAIMKLVARMGRPHEGVEALLRTYANSRNVDLQQRCQEYLALCKQYPSCIERLFPEDGSCEDVEVDTQLAFLDDFVRQQRNDTKNINSKPTHTNQTVEIQRQARDGGQLRVSSVLYDGLLKLRSETLYTDDLTTALQRKYEAGDEIRLTASKLSIEGVAELLAKPSKARWTEDGFEP